MSVYKITIDNELSVSIPRYESSVNNLAKMLSLLACLTFSVIKIERIDDENI